MACNPTRIELSNSAATVVEFTVTPDPGSVNLTFQVDALGIDETVPLTSGFGSVTIPAQTESDFSIFDGTIQVSTNAAVLVPVMVIESNEQQAVGVTVSDTGVSYCAPAGGGTVPIADSYLMLIEEAEIKTYVLDVASVAPRTITAFRGRTLQGSCTVELRGNGGTQLIGTLTASATAGPTTAPSLGNTEVSVGERLQLEVTANSTAEDLQIVVDYTQ